MKNSIFLKFKPIIMALLAALLYGVSAPFSKMLLKELSTFMMAALLYLGAGVGMLLVNTTKVIFNKERIEANITKNDLKYVFLMILLDIVAPIFFMLGLSLSTSSSASLLNNFEIVTTSMIALIVFKEAIDKRMWVALALITIASVILSIGDISSFRFSIGSLFIILACVSWGFENNCTRKLSIKDPTQIVIVKGFGSGLGALIIALSLKMATFNMIYMSLALLLGFLAYGLSIFFYIKAQRHLGAARTSAYYAAAPFIGVIISWLVLKESISVSFFIALSIMLVGTYFAMTEKHLHMHLHEETTHEHTHSHDDMHHTHTHDNKVSGKHSHLHSHKSIYHTHPHTPDTHHRHEH